MVRRRVLSWNRQARALEYRELGRQPNRTELDL
jgi:hypothetical protein